MPVRALYLYSFRTVNVYEKFVYNVCVAKITCFYFCPRFYKSFKNGKIPKNSVIFDRTPSKEVICFCHM